MTFIAGMILMATIINWNIWDLKSKIFALATILLVLHVLEEWHFPGGFHTMYNLMANSDNLACYPMNQLSDMWTNFIGVMFGCIVLIVGPNPFFLVMQLFLCCAEVFGHFSGGIYVYRRFKNQGKKTIYNPDLFTTIFVYISIAILIIISFITIETPSLIEFILALISSLILGAFSLSGVEKICLNKNSPYPYTWGNGYFTKYLDKEKVQ